MSSILHICWHNLASSNENSCICAFRRIMEFSHWDSEKVSQTKGIGSEIRYQVNPTCMVVLYCHWHSEQKTHMVKKWKR